MNELNAVDLGHFDLIGIGGHVLFAHEMQYGDMRVAAPYRGSRRVDGHIAASDDDYLLSGKVGHLAVTYTTKHLDSRDDIAAILSGKPGFAGALRTIWTFGCLCRENGIQLLYHNHDFEFDKISGMYMIDFLYEAMGPEILQTEFDTCWVRYAGEDPCAYLRKYAGRTPIVHLKDYVGRREGSGTPYGLLGEAEAKQNAGTPFEFRPYGYGCQDAAAVAEAALEAGTQWLIIEQDESPSHVPLEDAEKSIGTLRRLGIKD